MSEKIEHNKALGTNKQAEPQFEIVHVKQC